MGANQTKLLTESLEQLKEAAFISPANIDFWSRFWSISIPLRDGLVAIKTKDLQAIRQSNPRNFATLIVHLIARVRKATTQKNTAQDLQQVMSCIRLLTRLVPIAFEGSNEDGFENTLFWKNTIPGLDTSSKQEDKDGDDAQATSQADPNAATFDAVLKGKPLAVQLINSILSLLFFSDFTCVPFKEKQEERAALEELPLKYCWAPGVGTTTVEYYNQTAAFDQNRAEILLCLLTILSRSVYLTPSQLDAQQNKNPWVEAVVTKKRTSTRALLYSLFNVILRYDPVGWGVPYNYILSNNAPEQLMNVAVQVLNVLLEYRPVQAESQQTTESNTTASTEIAINHFAALTAALDSPADFDIIFKGLVRLLTNPVVATNTYLPGATKLITCHQELLCLFWQLIQINKAFLAYILRKDDFVDILYPMVHFMHEARKDNAQLGMVHLCTFMLLLLSGEREFSIALNRPFNKKLLIDISRFSGNYADYLILVIVKLFADGHSRLEALWECLLTILANISPYIKSLSQVTSMRLLKLFAKMSSRKFLFEKERNYRYLFFLLEVFNNIIQYQYEGNNFLAYAIISHRAYFFRLLDLVSPAVSSSPESQPSPDTTTSVADTQTPAQVEHKPANTDLPPQAAAKFEPTKEWLSTWAPRLPLGTIIRFLNGIMPQLESILEGTANDQEKIVSYLRKTTLVGMLPVPHPIVIRHYSNNKQTLSWFHQYMWGVIFIKLCIELPVLRDTIPQLFFVKLQNQPAPMTPPINTNTSQSDSSAGANSAAEAAPAQ